MHVSWLIESFISHLNTRRIPNGGVISSSVYILARRKCIKIFKYLPEASGRGNIWFDGFFDLTITDSRCERYDRSNRFNNKYCKLYVAWRKLLRKAENNGDIFWGWSLGAFNKGRNSVKNCATWLRSKYRTNGRFSSWCSQIAVKKDLSKKIATYLISSCITTHFDLLICLSCKFHRTAIHKCIVEKNYENKCKKSYHTTKQTWE